MNLSTACVVLVDEVVVGEEGEDGLLHQDRHNQQLYNPEDLRDAKFGFDHLQITVP